MSCRKANAMPGPRSGLHPLMMVSSVLAGISACCAMMLLFSWLMCSTGLPLFAAAPLSTAAAGTGALVTGAILSAVRGKNSLVCGLLSGCFYSTVLFLVALLAGQREFLPTALLKPICILLAGGIGGVLSAAASDKNKRKRSMKAK